MGCDHSSQSLNQINILIVIYPDIVQMKMYICKWRAVNIPIKIDCHLYNREINMLIKSVIDLSAFYTINQIPVVNIMCHILIIILGTSNRIPARRPVVMSTSCHSATIVMTSLYYCFTKMEFCMLPWYVMSQ